jgi:hypothetical protein
MNSRPDADTPTSAMRDGADVAAFRLAALGLLVAALAAAAISVVLLARYPAAMHLDGSGPLLVALVVGLCSAVGVAVAGLVARAPLLRTAARLGSRWGAVLGRCGSSK